MYTSKQTLTWITIILFVFLLFYTRINVFAQSSENQTKIPYLLAKISTPYTKEQCFVWDIKNNQYAAIKNNAGEVAQFPCDLNDILTWISKSENVGKKLFDPQPRGNAGFPFQGIRPTKCTGLSCHIIEDNRVCSEQVVNITDYWDEKGNFPLREVENFFEQYSYVPLTSSLQQGIYDANLPVVNMSYYNPQSFMWTYNNSAGGKSAYRTQKLTKYDIELKFGPGLKGKSDAVENYTAFTPLGVIAQWELHAIHSIYSSADKIYEEYRNGISVTKQKANGIYCDNAMAQIFTFEALGVYSHFPSAMAVCGAGIPPDYQAYSVISDFKTFASASYTVDAENADASTLQRNSAFEAAIVELKTKFQAFVGPPGAGKLTDYSFDLEFRKPLCPIAAIEVDKEPLMPDDTGKATAYDSSSTVVPSVIWSLEPKTGNAIADIDKETGFITNISGEGIVLIHVESSDNPECFKEKELQIGCEKCSGDKTCESPGYSEPQINSIELNLRLGKDARGQSNGMVFLKAKAPSLLNYTPQILEMFSHDVATRAIYNNNILRQISAYETFVDIVIQDPYAYTVFFYKPEARGKLNNDTYEVIPDSIPIITWKIENPDAFATVYNRLKLTKTAGSDTKVYEYLFDKDQNSWSLSKGNGLQIVAKKTEINGNLRVVTEIIKDNADIIASKKKTTYKVIEYSGVTREAIVEEVLDPDKDALTKTFTYYEGSSCSSGSCGQIESQINPDGFWVKYQYDSLGRKTLEISVYLDIAPTTDPASARAVYYDYTPLTGDSNAAEDKYKPRKITEKILGNTTLMTYYVYQVAGNGERTEISEQAANPSAAFGAAGNLRTVTVTNPYNVSSPGSWKTKSITFPDGKLDTYTYEYGTYAPNGTQPGSFTRGNGTDLRTTLIHGTTWQPNGVYRKTKREVIITNSFGREQYQETQSYDGYSILNWQVTLYDQNNRVSAVYNSDGTYRETTWGCCNLEAETDVQGIRTLYASYDGLGRLLTKVKKGTDTIADIFYNYTYDAAGRRLTETVSSTGLSLSTGQTYDLSGRVKTSIDASGLVTAYAYGLNGLQTTVTRPGGVIEITNRYLDGRTKSIMGTGVIPKYYEYTVQADGSQSTQVYNGSQGSMSWEKSTTDMLGRTLSREKPGYSGIETTRNFYDETGHLIKVSQPGLADTLYEYDYQIGDLYRSGLDADNDEYMDTRIIHYENEISDSFQVTHQSSSFFDENDELYRMQMQYQYTRLYGFEETGLIGEIISYDAKYNTTVSKTYLNRVTKTFTQIIDYPDSTINSETVTVNGLVMSQQSKSGVLNTFEYDALSRRTGSIDPRAGKSITYYNNKNQVDYVQDAAGNVTTFAYDPQTGRKISETNALNKTTYFSYYNLGQILRTWGAAEPVEYVYDNYGRLSELHTFRQGSNWQSPTWPEGNTGSADITKWHYQESTGLLLSKEYTDGKSVTYTYAAGGKLLTRTWARTTNGQPLVTTYSYDSGTGDLLKIDYSDNTPDVSFTYDGFGRQKTVTDYAGTRTFHYMHDQSELEIEVITGLMNKTITRTYETTDVPGRNTGFNLGPDYSVNYGYEANTGRFSSVDWSITNRTNGTNKTGIATYSYVAGSDLLQDLMTVDGQLVTYSYEPNRNLRTQVKNQSGITVISQYDYQYDPLGRRTNMATSGTAPWGTLNLQPETSNYATNALNQYTQITRDQQPETRNLSYDYDGNLTQSAEGTIGTKYAYDAENRLIVVEPQTPTSGTTKVEFAYDYMGRRVQKKVFEYVAGDWQLMTDSLFLYDGWNLVSEQTTRNSQPVTEKLFVYGLDLSQTLQGASGIGGLIAAVDNGEAYQYFYDGNGNVAQLVKVSDGSIAAHYEYDPYGNIIIESGSLAKENPIRFSTKFFDNETGLGYWGYRHYSPSLGRWINRDPSEEEGGQNLYAYASNNTINNIDPLGLWVRVDDLPDIAYQRAKIGDDVAAKRTTWQLWEAKCGDTITSLAKEVELELQDWPQWLSLKKAAPGAHALPDLIQPGDIYKVSKYAAIIGRALPNASLVALSPWAHYLAFTDAKGNYGFIWIKPKRTYEVRYEDVEGMIGIPRYLFRKFYVPLDYGEVKTLYFPPKLAPHWFE